MGSGNVVFVLGLLLITTSIQLTLSEEDENSVDTTRVGAPDDEVQENTPGKEDLEDPVSQDGEKTEGCGCSAAKRDNLVPIAEPENFEDDDVLIEDEDDTEIEVAATAQKYTSAANAQTTFPRTNQMIKVEGGDFVMGTDKPIIPADGEMPARKVSVRTFWMDAFEVSNSEFEIFVNSTGYKTEVGISNRIYSMWIYLNYFVYIYTCIYLLPYQTIVCNI